MRHSNKSVIAMNTPLRLSREEMEKPLEVLATFFGDLSLDETRDILWEAFARALCAQDAEPEDLSRTDLLYFHREIEALIEAAYLILNSAKRN
jgi:hypothetical protein